MKHPVLFQFLISIMLSGNVYSQSIFLEGFIIKNNGEKINGLIEYKPDQKVPSLCIFKRFEIAIEKAYNADELKAFGYRGSKRYESFTYRKKNQFFETLLLGNICLYKRGSDFFINKNGGPLTKIDDSQISFEDGGNTTNFKDTPSFLAFFTGTSRDEIKKDFRVKKDIVAYLESYNKKAGHTYYIINRKISEKQLYNGVSLSGANRNTFGIFSGLNIYDLNISFSSADISGKLTGYLPNPDPEAALTSGLYFERVLLRKTDKISARIELLYTGQTFYNYEEKKINSSIHRNDAFFDFKAIKVPVLFQYSFTGKRVVPFVNAGVAYQSYLSGNYYHIEEIETSYNDINTYDDKDLIFKKNELSCIAGFGVRTRLSGNLKLNLLTRVEYGSGVFINTFPENDFGTASYRKPYLQNSLQYSILIGLSF